MVVLCGADHAANHNDAHVFETGARFFNLHMRIDLVAQTRTRGGRSVLLVKSHLHGPCITRHVVRGGQSGFGCTHACLAVDQRVYVVCGGSTGVLASSAWCGVTYHMGDGRK